jgi:hypothetical protein
MNNQAEKRLFPAIFPHHHRTQAEFRKKLREIGFAE